jgi:hypothetical protein
VLGDQSSFRQNGQQTCIEARRAFPFVGMTGSISEVLLRGRRTASCPAFESPVPYIARPTISEALFSYRRAASLVTRRLDSPLRAALRTRYIVALMCRVASDPGGATTDTDIRLL